MVPLWVRGASEVVNTRQAGVLRNHRHHTPRAREHALHIDATLFVSQDVHHSLAVDPSCFNAKQSFVQANTGQKRIIRNSNYS